jgi:RNA polymerase sigma-70 factor, ECF subfamily
LTQEPGMTGSDESLMAAVSSGNLEAFSRLMERHQGAVWRAAWRFTGNPEDARDICQTVFLKLYEAGSRYTPSASFKTYLFRITNNTCIDHYRKKRHDEVKNLTKTTEIASSPEEKFDKQERGRRLRHTITRLPERQRRAVALRYEADLSIKEIASIMGITQKAVERLLARARETLREGIQEEMG